MRMMSHSGVTMRGVSQKWSGCESSVHKCERNESEVEWS